MTMRMDLYNAEMYVDYTAYKAIKNVMKDKETNKMDYLKGDIIRFATVTTSMNVGVVLSTHNGGCYVLAVMLSNTDNDLFSTVPVNTTEGVKYAHCDMVRFVKKDENDDFLKVVSDSEAEKLDCALAYVFGLTGRNKNEPEKPLEGSAQPNYCETFLKETNSAALEAENLQYRTEAATYKEMYMTLLDIVTGGKANAR